ncbi:MAG: RNA methyltransferase [Alphaproteobacteria bacterium]|nr:RNA methyltransferase [Alphaproteobacteria bacterium]
MAGTDRQRPLITGGPAVILVEPQLGENIGMVARAMANFGLSELRLVQPRDGWPNPKARAAASKADHVIDGTAVFDTLEAAIADLNFVFATTARARDGFKPVRGPQSAAQSLRARMESGQQCGVLFGRERWGLSNEEISLADEIVTYPVNPAFASLNIAQAVLLMSYEWMQSGLAPSSETPFSGPRVQPATKSDLQGFSDQLEEALQARGYFRPPAKKPKMVDGLRAVLSRPGFSKTEIQLLRGVIRSLDRFSRKSPRGSGPPDPVEDDEQSAPVAGGSEP